MFSGKPSKRNSTLQKDTTKDIDIDDIEHLLHDTLTNDEDDINENDFNDPELLAQLQELASSSSQKQAKPTQPSTKHSGRPLTAQQKGGDMNIDLDSYAALAQSEDDDIHVELNESDFTDPHLLEELSAISSATPMDIDKPQPKTTEQTENDGSLLQLVNMGFSQAQAKKALDMFDNDMERATNFLLDTPPSKDNYLGNNDMDIEDQQTTDRHSHDDTFADPTTQQQHQHINNKEDPSYSSSAVPTTIDNLDNTVDLKEKAKLLQQQALLAKKQGNKKEAVALLRESKLLLQQHQLTEQQESEDHNNVSVSKPSLDTKTPTSISPVLNPTTTTKEDLLTTNETTLPPPSSSSPSSVSSIPPSTLTPSPALIKAQQDLLQRVVQLQREYKEAAHHYKDLGNLVVTKEMIQISKSLLKTGIQLKQQQLNEQEVEQTGKRLPDHPDLFLGNGKLRSAQPVTQFNQPTIEQMEAQLTYQIDICHNLDIQCRASNKNNLQQANLLSLKQAFAADLVTLRASHESSGGPSIPSLHYEQVNYAYKNILDYLPLNQMELKIINGTGIQSLDIGTAVEPFVTWDFSGWPPENTAQAQLNKGETPVMKGTEPVFDFTILIPITRTNRLFMRHLQRKKLLLEVFHDKYNYGFLRRPVSIGKVAIPLDTLLTKTTISGWFDLVDNNRKKTGGRLKIQLGLCEPLNGQDIVTRSERWLVLDGLGQQTSQLMHSAGLTDSAYLPSTPTSNIPTSVSVTPSASPSTAITSPPVITSSPVKAATQVPSDTMDINIPDSMKKPDTSDIPATNNTELENAEEEIDSVDVLVSNMVLEHEINVANAAISKGVTTTEGSSSPRTKEDWMDRKQALDIKMNMLVIQVQTGMLDMQTYLDKVEQRMNRDRQLALIFKKHNRLDLAKLALSRKKIMQDELEEAKAAMAAQAEEGD
ncbi:hypothetical protein BC941DRAFT_417287 [Chlamydoabsidia padenii]|nr:hypothetical protein BC941DRAFT_417287 [Chlamydoabsidia padenii]